MLSQSQRTALAPRKCYRTNYIKTRVNKNRCNSVYIHHVYPRKCKFIGCRPGTKLNHLVASVWCLTVNAMRLANIWWRFKAKLRRLLFVGAAWSGRCSPVRFASLVVLFYFLWDFSSLPFSWFATVFMLFALLDLLQCSVRNIANCISKVELFVKRKMFYWCLAIITVCRKELSSLNK